MPSFYLRYDCPVCGGSRTRSASSGGTYINRDRFGGWYKARRRICLDCGNEFKTYEVFEEDWKILQDAKKHGVHKVNLIHAKQKSKWEKQKDDDNQS